MLNPWLIHVNVWQKPLQYFKVISLQLKEIFFLKRKMYTYLNWLKKKMVNLKLD